MDGSSGITQAFNPQHGQTQSLGGCSGYISMVKRLLFLLDSWRARYRQRLVLAMLDDHLLSDIGLSREDVAKQMSKPFWRA